MQGQAKARVTHEGLCNSLPGGSLVSIRHEQQQKLRGRGVPQGTGGVSDTRYLKLDYGISIVHNLQKCKELVWTLKC